MTTLGIDTATNYGTVGLVASGELKGEFTFSAKESQSEKLLATLDLLLREVKIDLEDLNRVAVSTGPGSFTGLRIGISTAKGLAHGLNLPVVGVSLTDCYYSRAKNYPGLVCPVIYDRRNLVYYALYDKDGKKIADEESTGIKTLNEILKKKQGDYPGKKPILLIGDGVYQKYEEFKKFDGVTLTEGRLNYPSGGQVGFLGSKANKNLNELNTIEPLYAQRPVAEINWEKKHKGDNDG